MLRRCLLAHLRQVKWTAFSAITATILLSMAFPSSHPNEQPKWDATYQASRTSRESGDREDGKLTRSSVTGHMSDKPRCTSLRPPSRTDCHPDTNVTLQRCMRRGCCWQPSLKDVPPCYVPVDYAGYRVVSKKATPSGTKLTLFHTLPSGSTISPTWVTVEVAGFDVDTLRVRIVDRDAGRYEPPVPPIPRQPYRSSERYPVHVTPSGTLVVGDASTSPKSKTPKKGDLTSGFEFHLNSLIFGQELNQLRVRLPAGIVYGLKSQTSSFSNRLQKSKHVFFANHRESGTLFPETTIATYYGGHPFFAMLHSPTGLSTGIFLFNSNEVEVQLAEDASATFRTTGGILDFFVFLGPTLSSVVSQYQNLVGFPSMPRYRLLRPHRTGGDIPSDLVGPLTIQKAQKVHKALVAERKMSTVPALDDMLVHDENGKPLVCPGMTEAQVYFMDFTHPGAESFWLLSLNRSQPFSDMTIYTFLQQSLDAPCCPTVYPKPSQGEALLRWAHHKGPLGKGRVSRSDEGSACPRNSLFYSSYMDVGHVYPYVQARLMSEALVQITRSRVAIVSDKSFSGQGKWSGHWVPRPEGSWKGLNHTLAELYRYSMYGIPMFGTSICHFSVEGSKDNQELCAAWLILATFFPIYRYKSSLEAGPIAKALADSTLMHDYFRPYMYTLLYQSSRYGNMVVRPMAFEFQDDAGAREIEHQFMWGPSLLVAPRIQPDPHFHEVYFPKGIWYDWQNGKRISSAGQRIFVPARDVKPGVYLRGGSIVPVVTEGAPSGDDNSIRVVVAPDSNGYATGIMYTDDGISPHPVERKKFSIFHFVYLNNTLVGHCSPCEYEANAVLNAVTFYGMKTRAKRAFVNGQKLPMRRTRTVMYSRNVTHSLLKPFVLLWQ